LTAGKPQSQFNIFKETYKAEFVLILVTFSWGLTFPLMKLSLDFISVMLFNFIRFVITFIFFCIIFRKEIELSNIKSNYKYWKFGFLIGTFLFFGFIFQTIGLKYTTASKSGFITSTSIVIIPFAQYFILKSKPKIENIVGGIIVMAGLFILTDTFFSIPNIGDILTFICAFSFAVYIVLLDKYSVKINLHQLLFGQFFSMVILSFVFMLFFEVYLFSEFNFNFKEILILTLLYNSLIATLLSILMMTKYQHKTSSLRAGIIYSMESVFAAFFSYLILNDKLNKSQIIGIFIMFIGLIISEFYTLLKLKIKS